MNATTVVHVRDLDGYDVYIGRASPRAKMKASVWANPYRVGRDGTRDEVIVKYRAYIMGRPDLMARIGELRGLRLACWCKSKGVEVPCHGDVLAELAEIQTKAM